MVVCGVRFVVVNSYLREICGPMWNSNNCKCGGSGVLLVRWCMYEVMGFR